MRAALGLARWIVALEVGIWRSLLLWVTRRVPGLGPGVRAFPYSRDVAPVMGAFIFASVLELPVVHLLLPWDTVRLVALVLSVWGLLWMVGYLASVRVFPHLLDEGGLRVRYGTTADVRVPWDAIAAVRSSRRSVPSRRTVSVEGAVASVAVLKQTRVDVVLREATTLELPGGPREVTELRLYADDPRAFVAAARRHVGPGAPALG